MISLSYYNGHGHIADPTSIALSYPSVSLFSPIISPAILDKPSFPTLKTHYHNCMI